MTDKFEAGPFDHNGAAVLCERGLRGLRYAIFDARGGGPVRIMRDRAAAIEFAMSLPVLDLPPVIPPAPINVSPRAVARRAELGLDLYQPVPEPNDGAAPKPMSPARARSGLGPLDRELKVASRPRERT
jgi:hypothetical protein